MRQVPHDGGGCSKCSASHLQIFTPEGAGLHTHGDGVPGERVEASQHGSAATQPGGADAQPDGPAADPAGSSSKKPTKRVKLELLELTAADLQQELMKQLGPLVWHLHVARHQAAPWQRTLDEMQPVDCIISMDFSGNAALVVGGEIQSKYWNRANATLFIAITWHWPLGADGPINTQPTSSSHQTRTTPTGAFRQGVGVGARLGLGASW